MPAGLPTPPTTGTDTRRFTSIHKSVKLVLHWGPRLVSTNGDAPYAPHDKVLLFVSPKLGNATTNNLRLCARAPAPSQGLRN